MVSKAARYETDEAAMARALDLARRGIGLTSPNPCVGAVIVHQGQVLGEGWHRRAGEAHAEVLAIREARRQGHVRKLSRSKLYVTLEPCSTTGRTPPCTQAIREAGLAEVVVAARDPNPEHRGRGLRILRRHGVKVRSGVLEEEATDLNRAFNQVMTTGLPWVVAKIAMSLDGRIVPPEVGQQWLTEEKARRLGHELRWEADAIVVGGKTVRADDPALTIRLPRRRVVATPAELRGMSKLQPWRVIMTRGGQFKKTSLQLFADAFRERTLVFRSQAPRAVLEDLRARGANYVLLEGGGEILGQFFAESLVNELAFFVAPCIVGSGPSAVQWPGETPGHDRVRLSQLSITPCGKDFIWRGRPSQSSNAASRKKK